jgi:4-hydroxy-tetrahydrodipicolinate reductase
MNIALWGYGKMGKEVEAAAHSRGHRISCIIKKDTPLQDIHECLKQADVVIEFTTPDAFIHNLNTCLEAGAAMVSGTTGWYKELETVKKRVEEKKGTLLYASNFSLGANLFFTLNKKLAQLMKPFTGEGGYRVLLEEIHHIHKKDAPSGTAITLKQDLMHEAALSEPEFILQSDAPHYPEVPFLVSAIRKDAVTGIHRIEYKNETDAIRIEHDAFSRKGFALGAVLAAEWVFGKKGIFTMQQVLE